MEQLIMEWFRQFGEILNALGPTGTLISLLVFVIWNRSRETERDDMFRAELLSSHAKSVQSNQQAVENNGKIVSLLEAHDRMAQERSDSHFIRDQKHLTALEKITNYLTILDDTQDTIENIETTATRIQGNIADLQTDLPSLITRKADDTQKEFEALRLTLKQNNELVVQAIDKIADQLATRDKAHVMQNQSIVDALTTIKAVVNNNHNLIQKLIPAPEPPPAKEMKPDFKPKSEDEDSKEDKLA